MMIVKKNWWYGFDVCVETGCWGDPDRRREGVLRIAWFRYSHDAYGCYGNLIRYKVTPQ